MPRITKQKTQLVNTISNQLMYLDDKLNSHVVDYYRPAVLGAIERALAIVKVMVEAEHGLHESRAEKARTRFLARFSRKLAKPLKRKKAVARRR